MENASVKQDKSDKQHVLTTNSVQVQNVRNLSSNVKKTGESSLKDQSAKKPEKKPYAHSSFAPPTDCPKLRATCPSFNRPLHCSEGKNICDKGCNHNPPVKVCNRKTPPYLAFSDMLDDSIVPFSNITQCHANQREFDSHLEEKKVVPSKKPPTKSSVRFRRLKHQSL